MATISRNPKPHAVAQLVSGYPSHDFIIDREEASELFRNVSEPDKSLYSLIGEVSDFTHKPSQNGIVFAFEAIVSDNPTSREEEIEGNDDQTSEATETETEPVDESGTTDQSGDQESQR